jgi:serine/threonine-protein kinase
MAAADTVKQFSVQIKGCPECGARFGIEAAFCPFDGSALAVATWDRSRDPRARRRVGDRYDVIDAIGEGGMGTVYRVRHVSLDRLFAMKVLRADLAADAELARRFVQEARATAAIKHPSIVAITDFGEMEDGIPYFVMELLEGETLASRVRRAGAMPADVAARIGERVADALVASHAANVIHRDLKPDNVFLVRTARADDRRADDIRVVDFGAAKIVGGSRMTRPGIVFGTPYYMSPEQAAGQAIDGRADVYSLGVLLYELVTGRVPFEADTYVGVMTKHLFEPPPRPVSPSGRPLGALEQIVMRALEKEPERRFASMLAMRDELARIAGTGRAGEAGAAAARRSPDHALRGDGLSSADRIARSVSRRVAAESRRRRRFVTVAVLSGSAAIAFVAAVVALRPERPDVVAAPAPSTAATAPAASSSVPAEPVGGGSTSASTALSTSSPGEPSEVPAAGPPATPLPNGGARRPPAVQVRPRPAAAPEPRPASRPQPQPSAVPAIAPDFKDPWK